MDGSQPINPFLTGNYGPVRSEDDFDLPVTGEIPAALAGAFYRNGPNPQFDPGPGYHWFGGDGMIHAFFVEGGKVRYRNRWVRTPKWEVEHAAGRRLFGTFGNPMESDPSVIGMDSGVANTNIVWHAGRLLALEEGHAPIRARPAHAGTARLCRELSRPGHRPSQARSRDRRDGVVRLLDRRGAAQQPAFLRRHRQGWQGRPPRRFRGAPTARWSTTSW